LWELAWQGTRDVPAAAYVTPDGKEVVMKRFGLTLLLVAIAAVLAVPAARAACPAPDDLFQKIGQGSSATPTMSALGLNHQAVEPLDLSSNTAQKLGGSMATQRTAGCYYYYCYYINVDGWCCEDFSTCLGVCGGACGGTCDY
jgi:hypothetical protein